RQRARGRRSCSTARDSTRQGRASTRGRAPRRPRPSSSSPNPMQSTRTSRSHWSVPARAPRSATWTKRPRRTGGCSGPTRRRRPTSSESCAGWSTRRLLTGGSAGRWATRTCGAVDSRRRSKSTTRPPPSNRPPLRKHGALREPVAAGRHPLLDQAVAHEPSQESAELVASGERIRVEALTDLGRAERVGVAEQVDDLTPLVSGGLVVASAALGGGAREPRRRSGHRAVGGFADIAQWAQEAARSPQRAVQCREIHERLVPVRAAAGRDRRPGNAFDVRDRRARVTERETPYDAAQ